MARTDPKITLYIPAELKDRIKEAAEENRRSVNSEIIIRLEESFDKKDHLPPMPA